MIDLNPKDLTGISVFGKRILVNIIETKEKTSKGIYLHAYRHENYFKAVVLQSNLTNISKGDIVIIQKDLGKDARVKNSKYLLFTGTEGILAKVGYVNETGESDFYGDTEL